MDSNSILKNFVDKTIVLNLDERRDRLRDTILELDKLSLSFQRFSAIKNDIGWRGYNASILKILEENIDVENLFLVEDDCKLVGDLNIIEKGIKELPDDWDALWLGSNLQSLHSERVSNHLYRLRDGWNTHAIILSKKFREWCLEKWDKSLVFDEFLRIEAQSQKNCYVLYPMVAIQRASYSNIINGPADYEETFMLAQKKFI